MVKNRVVWAEVLRIACMLWIVCRHLIGESSFELLLEPKKISANFMLGIFRDEQNSLN